MSKHTQSGFRVVYASDGTYRLLHAGATKMLRPSTVEEMEANCALFEVAPEMLEHLKNFPGFLADQKAQDAWLAGMVAVIAKAETA